MATSNARGERTALHRTMEAIMAESKRSSSQGQLPGIERTAHSMNQATGRALPEWISELVFDLPARRRLSELVLAPPVVEEVKELLQEFAQAPLLREHSLEPRHTLLLVGPPGNGKTSLAEMVATELSLPLLSVRYDAIVDSFLGETANRLRRLIDYATLNPCVLFFDEFDAVGKERSDAQETGEIKRVVSSLLMLLDRLPSHALVVCATNHPELLDRAVWRRFEVRLQINQPNAAQLVDWFERFQRSLNDKVLGITPVEFAELMQGENMSEVEALTLDVRRKIVLSDGKLTPAQAMQQVLERRKRRIKSQKMTGAHGEHISNRSAQTRAKKGRANQGEKAVLSKEDSPPAAD